MPEKSEEDKAVEEVQNLVTYDIPPSEELNELPSAIDLIELCSKLVVFDTPDTKRTKICQNCKTFEAMDLTCKLCNKFVMPTSLEAYEANVCDTC